MIPGIIPFMSARRSVTITFSELRSGATQNFADFTSYPEVGDVIITYTFDYQSISPSSGNPSQTLSTAPFAFTDYNISVFYCVVEPGQTHCSFTGLQGNLLLVHYKTNKTSVTATVQNSGSQINDGFTLNNSTTDVPCVLAIASYDLNSTNGGSTGLDYYGRNEVGNLVASYGFTNTGGGSMYISQSGSTLHVFGVISLE